MKRVGRFSRHYFVRKLRAREVVLLVAAVIVAVISLSNFKFPNISYKPALPLAASPTLTFCLVPYPVYSKHISNLYQITFSSYLETSLTTKILILMPREDFDSEGSFLKMMEDRYGKGRIIFSQKIETDESEVPYIDSWFILGLDSTKSDLICWINSDIIVPKGWFERVSFIYSFFSAKKKQAAIISRRCDFDFDLDSPTNISWPIDYERISADRKEHSPWGVDFYLLSREPSELNIDEMPRFHMGRYRWDPWTTGWLNEKASLTTLGDFCTFHINHPPKSREMSEPKVKENFEEAARNNRYSASNTNAHYVLRSIGPSTNWTIEVGSKRLSH